MPRRVKTHAPGAGALGDAGADADADDVVYDPETLPSILPPRAKRDPNAPRRYS